MNQIFLEISPEQSPQISYNVKSVSRLSGDTNAVLAILGPNAVVIAANLEKLDAMIEQGVQPSRILLATELGARQSRN